MSRKETERAMVGNFTVEWESAFSLEEEEGRKKNGERRRSTLRRVPGWSRSPFEWFMDRLLLHLFSAFQNDNVTRRTIGFRYFTWTFNTKRAIPRSDSILASPLFSRFEGKSSFSFFLEALWKKEKKRLSLGAYRVASYPVSLRLVTARRDKKEGLLEARRVACREFPSGDVVCHGRHGRRRKRLAEGCFERITTNSWRQKNDDDLRPKETASPSFPSFPASPTLFKIKNETMIERRQIDGEISLLSFLFLGRKFWKRVSRSRNSKRVEFFSSRRKRCIIRVIAQLLRNCWPSSRPTSLPG